MINLIKRIQEAYKYAGTTDNMSIYKLIRQAIPYYLSPRGFSFYPLTIYLSINSVCNLRCKMCDIGQKNIDSSFYKNLRTDGSELSFEQIKKLIDEVKSFKPLIAINSTEPLLHRDLIKICRYIIESGLNVQITTNGFLLEKFAEQFVNMGLHRLWVSLDAPPEIHNSIRGRESVFENAVAGIQLIDELKREHKTNYPQIFIANTITNYNYDCLVDFMECINLDEIERVHFFYINFVTSEMAEEHNKKFGDICKATVTTITEETNPTKVNVDTLITQIDTLKKIYPTKCVFVPDFTDKEIRTFFDDAVFIRGKKCTVPWFIAQILSNGDVIPMTRCYNLQLGNIKTDGFKSIWNGRLLRDFRLELKKNGAFPGCSRCGGAF